MNFPCNLWWHDVPACRGRCLDLMLSHWLRQLVGYTDQSLCPFLSLMCPFSQLLQSLVNVSGCEVSGFFFFFFSRFNCWSKRLNPVKEYGQARSLNLHVFFFFFYTFQRHVGVQKRLFFQITSSHAWLRFRSLSGLSLSHCTQQHNLAAAGGKLPMALFRNIKMSWLSGKQTFRKTAVSNLINCSHENIIRCSLGDKKWAMMRVCVWGWVRVKGAIQKKWLPKKPLDL